MIKRFGAILLAMLYLGTVSGFALNLHYCGRLLTSVNIDAAAKGCGMLTEGKMKCCKDKKIEVKVKDVHQSTSTTFVAKTFVVALSPILFGSQSFFLQQTFSARLLNKAPPDIPQQDIPVFLKNNTFRI